MAPTLTHRPASSSDIALLAEMNRQLSEDEGHRNRMSLPELETRLRKWLSGRYVATLFARDGETVAYALWRDEAEWVYLRQFFVARNTRREGIGREAIALLTGEVWPRGKRARVEVLLGNEAGLAFWRAVGFRDYFLTLEMSPNRFPDPLTSRSAV